jgi:hypothetical protein
MTPFRRMVIATIPISLVVVLSWFIRPAGPPEGNGLS